MRLWALKQNNADEDFILRILGPEFVSASEGW